MNSPEETGLDISRLAAAALGDRIETGGETENDVIGQSWPGAPGEPPPDTGLFTASPPEAENGDCDAWGNIRLDPVKTIEEAHGGNFVKIFIYEYRGAYFFGFQIKIEKVIRQKRANVQDLPLKALEAARKAARGMIIRICKENHVIKRLYTDFAVIGYNQPELF
jgi:hypothetical protein